MQSICMYTVHCTVSTSREGYHICIVYNHEAIRSPSPPPPFCISVMYPCILLVCCLPY